MKAIIYVEPHAKGRPRMTSIGGHAVAYTPKNTRIAESDIKAAIRDELKRRERFGEGVPLVLYATFYRARPKTLKKSVKLPVQRPDLDNYLKTLLDALNKYAYVDDSQITQFVVNKRFAPEGTPPRIEFILEVEEI